LSCSAPSGAVPWPRESVRRVRPFILPVSRFQSSRQYVSNPSVVERDDTRSHWAERGLAPVFPSRAALGCAHHGLGAFDRKTAYEVSAMSGSANGNELTAGKPERPVKEWTVAIYMVADGPSGNAALDAIAARDILQILGAAAPHHCHGVRPIDKIYV